MRLILCAAAVMAGCAFTPMKVELAPDTGVPVSNIGEGRTVYLAVSDERPTESIGNRGSAYMTGAQITLGEDLTAVVQSAMAEMLGTKGFDVVFEEPEAPHSNLRVDIRGLQYDTSTGFWTGGVEVTAALKATAANEFETYENFYRYEDEDRVVFVPGAEGNSQRINAALNDVLHQAVADRKLLEVLAGR